MKLFPIIIGLLLCTSCTKNEGSLRTLNIIIDRIQMDNTNTCSRFIRDVEDGGNRPLDVQLANRLDALLRHRLENQIPVLSDSVDKKFKIEKVYQYLINASGNIKEFETFPKVQRLINELNNKPSDVSMYERRMLLIELLLIESEIFNEFERNGPGERDIFCHRFNMHTTYDEVRVGQHQQLIISKTGLDNSRNIHEFDSVSLTVNGETLPIEFNALGGSVYINFIPKKSGKHIISGIMRTIYRDFDFDYDCGFQFPILVAEE